MHERAVNSRVSLIAAPVYDQDTTQIAEYDGGMYIISLRLLLHLINRLERAGKRDANRTS